MTPSTARLSRLVRQGRAVLGCWPLRLQLLLRLLPVLGLGAGLACSGDHLTREPPREPPREPAALYWDLELNHHAVTLSLLPPYDTLTLLATPRNALGEPLDDVGTPQYSSPDLDRVQVTPEGVLRAVGLTTDGQPLAVVATLTVGNLKHVDTVLVRVVADTLPKLAGLSIHPIPPDSAKAGADIGNAVPRRLPIQAVDGTGSPISDPLIAVRSLDPLTIEIIKRLGSPAVYGRRLGVATVVASATVFGVTKADTVPYRVGWPVYSEINFLRHVPVAGGDEVGEFSPPEIRVGVGALVAWQPFTSSDITTTDVTFADGDTANIAPADAATAYFVEYAKFSPVPDFDARHFICILGFGDRGGDCDGRGSFVLSPETYQRAYRVFLVPGTYEYHSTRSGATGRVLVMDER